MKTIIEYLDDLKGKNGSDYATAKLLKTRQTTISNIRNRHQCGDETAIKIANLLEVREDEVLIAAAIARSEGPVKNAWIAHAQRAGLANILLAVTLTPSIFRAALCILC